MLPLLLPSLASVCVLSGPFGASAVATETVVGVAGQEVRLPCRLEEAGQTGVEVCWGRGRPSLFTCHNTLVNAAGDQVTYRRSHRFSMSSSGSALSISGCRLSDAGFYHCRAQLAGLFNDRTSSVHLIVLSPPSVTSKHQRRGDVKKSSAHTPTGFTTEQRGSDVTGGAGTEPMVALVQSAVQEEAAGALQTFVGGTLRLSFVVFVPLVLLSAAYRVWRSRQGAEPEGRADQSEEEEEEEQSSSV